LRRRRDSRVIRTLVSELLPDPYVLIGGDCVPVVRLFSGSPHLAFVADQSETAASADPQNEQVADHSRGLGPDL
jgi:hypothetical protein